MAKFRVCFTQQYFYTVEAEDEDDAINKAESDFMSDMRCPIANTIWDEAEAWEMEEDT